MRILITGSSGFIGSALVAALEKEGHSLVRLTRSPSQAAGTIILWDPDASRILDHDKLEGHDAVIHLAGKGVAVERWSIDVMAAIRNSRVHGTALLARTLAELRHPPRVFLSASAIGFYGSRGDEIITEQTGRGSGFLASVCEDWEAAAREAGPRIRTVMLRFGFVLSHRRGGLPKMLAPFKSGLGGIIGNGRQFMSWVTMADVVGAIRFLLDAGQISGPVNVVSPAPVTNREFTRALGRTLARPTLVRLPAFAARLIIGEMADALLLCSQRIAPEKLLRAGFSFQHPEIEGALRHVLCHPPSSSRV